MMLFKNTRTAKPAEDVTAKVRLSAIVGRSHAEHSFYPTFSESPTADRVQRRFWTPDELAAEVGGD